MTQLQYFAGVTNDGETSDTVTVPTGTFVILDANGNLVDSGIKITTAEDFETMLDEAGFTTGGD